MRHLMGCRPAAGAKAGRQATNMLEHASIQVFLGRDRCSCWLRCSSCRNRSCASRTDHMLPGQLAEPRQNRMQATNLFAAPSTLRASYRDVAAALASGSPPRAASAAPSRLGPPTLKPALKQPAWSARSVGSYSAGSGPRNAPRSAPSSPVFAQGPKRQQPPPAGRASMGGDEPRSGRDATLRQRASRPQAAADGAHASAVGGSSSVLGEPALASRRSQSAGPTVPWRGGSRPAAEVNAGLQRAWATVDRSARRSRAGSASPARVSQGWARACGSRRCCSFGVRRPGPSGELAELAACNACRPWWQCMMRPRQGAGGAPQPVMGIHPHKLYSTFSAPGARPTPNAGIAGEAGFASAAPADVDPSGLRGTRCTGCLHACARGVNHPSRRAQCM